MIYQNFKLHTLIPTFASESKLQYLGIWQENAESLAPLFSSQHLVPEQIPEKCKLRDVIVSLALTHSNRLVASPLDFLGMNPAIFFCWGFGHTITKP